MTLITEDTLWAPEEIGVRYDKIAKVPAVLSLGENLHFGYWDDPAAVGDIADAMTRLSSVVFGKLDVGPGHRVLDVGCGVGGPAVRLAKTTGAEVVGITVSQEQVRKASELAEAEGVAHLARFQLADAMNLPFQEGEFDAAFALESIMHMDRVGVLSRVARVLRPGGQLALTDEVLLAPIPADRAEDEDILVRYMRSNLIRSLATVEGYPALLVEAGFVDGEVLDVSANVITLTFQTLWQRAQENARKILSDMGSQQRDVDEELQVWQRLAEIPEFGYLVVSARRP
ncbi:SAM-dependent methyltransferase [Saccharopolyspora phatthalungensis]|uniref:SAM-dependent methyltransferase n=1 Tax=Saccharopolyspora phatthalungensis TaxID=664693 RepID=A0A840QC07_9PSEU|nr:methyltransferase domain-containing protein [Saccharopolyspora phatthalungensis]MBB5157310.1 SAM-dependent methyltransferase [Saccharopolyspora phatthalungensis]